MTLPNLLKPVKCKLIRCGSQNDGGYLVSKKSIERSKSLISFGILDDCSFENHFIKINEVPVVCFDKINYKTYWKKRIYNDLGAAIFNLNYQYIKNTFNKFFKLKNFFKSHNVFIEKKIIKENDLTAILKNNQNIIKPYFLKIDIEGSEYRILSDIIKNKDLFEAIIIEFHDVDLHLERITKFVKDLNFKVTHIHGNNFERISNNIPIVLEITFEKNPDTESGFAILPNRNDAPCNPKNQEISLNFD